MNYERNSNTGEQTISLCEMDFSIITDDNAGCFRLYAVEDSNRHLLMTTQDMANIDAHLDHIMNVWLAGDVEVTNFIHANQPYSTDYIEGTWRQYDESDLQAYHDAIKIAEELSTGIGMDHKVRSLQEGLRLLEARMKRNMGVLVGKVVKCTPYRASFGRTHRDRTGDSVRLESVSRLEIARGEKVSVAM